jgi:formylmethanofuran dehydrogenase subunit B
MDDPGSIDDATCLACGCLCDDLRLRVDGGRIVEASKACEAGKAWFLGDHSRGDRPAATIAGREVPLDEALTRAAEILATARGPLVTGLTWASVEAQAAAVAVADRIGAAIDPGHGDDAIPSVLAIQRVGRVSATLGEVRNRADVVVFWGVDPVTTHPRHWERYSVEPRGRFVPRGREGRFVVVVDAMRTPTAERADLFVPLEAGAQLAALASLRAMIRGARLDVERASELTGVPASTLRELASRLKAARYGAFFFGERLGRSRGGAGVVEAALTLVRDLNSLGTSRFVALTLGRAGNPAGAEAVLAWQAAAPVAVDFRRGFPRFLPAEASTSARLAAGTTDTLLIVSPGRGTQSDLGGIPVVRIAPDATDPGLGAAVGLAAATTGIHAGGTVMRCDGVSLPLRPALTTDLPTDRDLLLALDARLAEVLTRG